MGNENSLCNKQDVEDDIDEFREDFESSKRLERNEVKIDDKIERKETEEHEKPTPVKDGIPETNDENVEISLNENVEKLENEPNELETEKFENDPNDNIVLEETESEEEEEYEDDSLSVLDLPYDCLGAVMTFLSSPSDFFSIQLLRKSLYDFFNLEKPDSRHIIFSTYCTKNIRFSVKDWSKVIDFKKKKSRRILHYVCRLVIEELQKPTNLKDISLLYLSHLSFPNLLTLEVYHSKWINDRFFRQFEGLHHITLSDLSKNEVFFDPSKHRTPERVKNLKSIKVFNTFFSWESIIKSNSSGITSLEVTDSSNITDSILMSFNNLKELKLLECPKITPFSLNFLSKKLEVLHLEYMKCVSSLLLKQMKNLRELEINGNYHITEKAFSEMRVLRVLRIGYNDRIENSALKSLALQSTLRVLVVNRCENLHSFNGLKNLLELEIRYNKKVINRSIDKLNKIRKLTIVNCPNIKSSVLSYFRETLVSLSLQKTPVIKDEDIRRLKKLEKCSLTNCFNSIKKPIDQSKEFKGLGFLETPRIREVYIEGSRMNGKFLECAATKGKELFEDGREKWRKFSKIQFRSCPNIANAINPHVLMILGFKPSFVNKTLVLEKFVV